MLESKLKRQQPNSYSTFSIRARIPTKLQLPASLVVSWSGLLYVHIHHTHHLMYIT